MCRFVSWAASFDRAPFAVAASPKTAHFVWVWNTQTDFILFYLVRERRQVTQDLMLFSMRTEWCVLALASTTGIDEAFPQEQALDMERGRKLRLVACMSHMLGRNVGVESNLILGWKGVERRTPQGLCKDDRDCDQMLTRWINPAAVNQVLRTIESSLANFTEWLQKKRKRQEAPRFPLVGRALGQHKHLILYDLVTSSGHHGQE